MLSKDQIKQILADQRATILNKSLGIERTLLSDIDMPNNLIPTVWRKLSLSVKNLLQTMPFA